MRLPSQVTLGCGKLIVKANQIASLRPAWPEKKIIGEGIFMGALEGYVSLLRGTGGEASFRESLNHMKKNSPGRHQLLEVS